MHLLFCPRHYDPPFFNTSFALRVFFLPKGSYSLTTHTRCSRPPLSTVFPPSLFRYSSPTCVQSTCYWHDFPIRSVSRNECSILLNNIMYIAIAVFFSTIAQ